MRWRNGDRNHSVEICYVFLYLVTARIAVTINGFTELVIVLQLRKSVLAEVAISGVRSGRRRVDCTVSVLIACAAGLDGTELGGVPVQVVTVLLRFRMPGRSAALVLSPETGIGRVRRAPQTSGVSAPGIAELPERVAAKVFDILTAKGPAVFGIADVPVVADAHVSMVAKVRVSVGSDVRGLEIAEAHVTVLVIARRAQHAAKVSVHRLDRVAAHVITDCVLNVFIAGLLAVPHVGAVVPAHTVTRAVHVVLGMVQARTVCVGAVRRVRVAVRSAAGGAVAVVLVQATFDPRTVCGRQFRGISVAQTAVRVISVITATVMVGGSVTAFVVPESRRYRLVLFTVRPVRRVGRRGSLAVADSIR